MLDDIYAVDLTPRSDGWLDQTQNLDIWLSPTQDYALGTKVGAGVSATALGTQFRWIVNPPVLGSQWLTIVGHGAASRYLSLATVAVRRNGEAPCTCRPLQNYARARSASHVCPCAVCFTIMHVRSPLRMHACALPRASEDKHAYIST